MKSLSRLITGGALVVFSAWFIVYLGALLTGGFFLIIGLFIIFNEEEDKIEEIKKKK
jgi:hypothetical protein